MTDSLSLWVTFVKRFGFEGWICLFFLRKRWTKEVVFEQRRDHRHVTQHAHHYGAHGCERGWSVTTGCSDLWLLLVVSCFSFGEVESFHSMISWGVLPYWIEWAMAIMAFDFGIFVHHGIPVAKILARCRPSIGNLNESTGKIHCRTCLVDIFNVQHWKVCRKTIWTSRKQQQVATPCPIMSTMDGILHVLLNTMLYIYTFIWVMFIVCYDLRNLEWKPAASPRKKNVFATRVGPEVCYLIQVCRFKPTQIDILILYQRLIWKNNWRTLVLDFFRQHVVSMPGTSSTFLPGLSSHHFSKWHGVLRATFDGTLGKSALRSLGWEAVSVILNEWGAVWLFGQQNVGCFFTWDGRLLDFWDSIADAWWNNMLHKLIYIYVYIYIYRFIDIVIDTWFNNPVPTVQTLPGVAILTGIELMICFVHSALFHVLDAGGFYHFRNWPLGGEEFPGWYAWSIGWRRGEDGRGWPEKCLTTSNEGKQESLEIEPFKRCVPKMPEWSCNSC